MVHSAVSSTAFRNAARNYLPAAAKLRDDLSSQLERYMDEAHENHLQSPTRRMALYISCMTRDGRSDEDQMSDMLRLLTLNSFMFRAKRLRAYVGECDVDANTDQMHKLFARLALDKAGKTVSFDDFKALVEREVFGIVITAHPTFTVSEKLTRLQAALAIGKNEDGQALSAAELDEMVKIAADTPHGSQAAITLLDEQRFGLMAIGNIHKALRRIYAIVFDVARELYPDQWQTLTPRLLTVASWVGYDLDGRADIRWSDTLSMRMGVEQLALEEYLESLNDLGTSAEISECKDLIKNTLDLVTADMERLACDPDSTDDMGAFSRALVDSLGDRLVSIGAVTDLLSKAIDGGTDNATGLAVLRAEMANFGLSFAHTHMRINAAQLTNAIRHELDISTSPEDPASRRRYLVEISKLVKNVEPVNINFGSIMNE
ncbi:MAG: phosphoenolpyruvate carboxylase, partial [Magnetovibrio sp.]|nr:phosphoenolpyruvate carboxylase [Magnetovibrio sp.]